MCHEGIGLTIKSGLLSPILWKTKLKGKEREIENYSTVCMWKRKINNPSPLSCSDCLAHMTCT